MICDKRVNIQICDTRRDIESMWYKARVSFQGQFFKIAATSTKYMIDCILVR